MKIIVTNILLEVHFNKHKKRNDRFQMRFKRDSFSLALNVTARFWILFCLYENHSHDARRVRWPHLALTAWWECGPMIAKIYDRYTIVLSRYATWRSSQIRPPIKIHGVSR